jgi:hypothetical protein
MVTGMHLKQMLKYLMRMVFLKPVIYLKFHLRILKKNITNFAGDVRILLFEEE